MKTIEPLMKSIWRINTLIVLLLTGCSAAGVPYTNDPRLKLVDAYELERIGRAAPAQQLALEALEIYKKKGNKRGEADVYNFFGGFYRGRAYRNFGEKVLLKNNRPYDPTNNTSIMYYQKAINIWWELYDLKGVAKSTLELGVTYGMDGKHTEECAAYRESLVAYEKGKSLPTIQEFEILNKSFRNFEDMANAFIKNANCE
jgi:hypothetical protein